jgi:7,8-didemethyl-8-hydroxy-5-deazariboflavin synthase CofH subunit
VEAVVSAISPAIEAVLDHVRAGGEVSVAQGTLLASAQGRDLHAVVAAADALREEQVGDRVSYVVNRNINFTNVCIKHCTFCAFSRDHREEQGYFLPTGEIVRRAREAWDLGATEVCLQAGLPPKLDGWYYVELVRTLKRELPGLHLHAFSPEEILYGATRAGVTLRDYLSALRDVGHDTLPGTSAEILDDAVRDVIARGRITTAQWIEVVTTAHELGIRTTSTMMFGHIETPGHWAAHMALLRDVQKSTGGFTEFVPLSLIHQEAPMYQKKLVAGVREGATGREVVLVHALARLMLGKSLRNIQASWVKEGPKMAQYLLNAGANDLGGTLINESISTSAGSAFGQLVKPRELQRIIRDAGRIPVQRSSTYGVLGEGDDLTTPLDAIDDPEARFGSYRKLTLAPEFRFQSPAREPGTA